MRQDRKGLREDRERDSNDKTKSMKSRRTSEYKTVHV